MKVLRITSCNMCPYQTYVAGTFYMYGYDGCKLMPLKSVSDNLYSGTIHPDCKLEDEKDIASIQYENHLKEAFENLSVEDYVKED